MAIFLRKFYRKFSFWQTSKLRSGILAQNAQDDLIVLSVFGIHHVFGGSIMIMGSILNNNSLWRHGYLIETGFEVCDLLAMLTSTFPYTENLKPKIKNSLVFHHIPGITLAIPILTTGISKNHHLHIIGGALLFAGGISASVGALIFS